jgi:hypothetical protein
MGWEFYKEKTYDGESIMAVMGSTSEKCTLSGTKLWGLSNKDETGRVTYTSRMSRCSVSVWVI